MFVVVYLFHILKYPSGASVPVSATVDFTQVGRLSQQALREQLIDEILYCYTCAERPHIEIPIHRFVDYNIHVFQCLHNSVQQDKPSL